MVTFADVERILDWARRTGHKVRVKFRGYPYLLAIDKYIYAEEPGGRKVEWARAFGPKPPHQVLSSYGVEYVEVSGPSGTSRVRDIRELLRMV